MRRRRALALVSAAAVAVAVPLAAGQGQASSPQSQSINVPGTVGSTVMVTWTGTIPPGVNPTSTCDGTTPEDTHDITVNVPAGTYSKVTAAFTFSITWNPSSGDATTNDEIITVDGPSTQGQEGSGSVGSSDTAGTTEVVNASNLLPSTYKVRACGFLNTTLQPYTGKLVIKTAGAAGEASLPSAPANGLAFSASVAADPQRDEAEPLIETAPDGHTYTCGPTGFGSAADYAQVSTDGGDQFHLIGSPPRGQQAVGGGGDCSIALAPEKNALGNYQYAYTGLGPLTGFTTSTSPDNGRTILNAPVQGNGLQSTGVLADRQWSVFLDKDTALLNYNQQAPRNIVVQRSDDAGLTYSPLTAVGGADPDFPGPMRTLPATFNPLGSTKGRVVYFGWNREDKVNLSWSGDGGRTFRNCVAAVDPGQPRAGFVTVDNDSAGNIYMAYAEKARFHSYMVVLPAGNLSKCNQPVTPGNSNLSTEAVPPKNDPATVGFTKPVQVDRDAVRTTVFPWLAAGGAPGRVAVTFYGTQTEGDPNRGDFKASWNVYVNQSVNALSSTRTFSQVKATTHPFHYNSICLNGLGCSLTQPNGDRSLADFFAIKTNPATGKLQVVYDNDAKKATENFGHVASPMVFTQTGGPSIKGGTISNSRSTLRASSTDPTGDAQSNYSNLFVSPHVLNTAPMNQLAADFTSVTVSPYAEKGGFSVTMQLASLSQVNLDKALSETESGSLLYVFRFLNGYQPAALVARYQPADPVSGQAPRWTFKYNDYQTLATQCLAVPSTSDDKCLAFGVAGQPGGGVLGSVNTSTGTITMKLPRNNTASGNAQLFALSGSQGDKQTPGLVPAVSGSRFYDASAFTLGDTQTKNGDIREVQSYLYPLDNTPAMDFLLP